ncbi:hypothetical protein PF005_g18669 [Phytophthora fragariae]|uniref:Uncharacterized protein n=2 Tax=Phytophthora TaxID=4783 RepID=A0A6A3WWF6_9STRA|nr:hypothetical protein PF009_g17011 [Phytophthora fragariae]KAE8980930.1 hypothetical protein PR001_g24150 [Phytophthora rubi]KAE8992814.1 hypothetical protein PF011_g17402 [Phytophthora fragariae]KAE8998257.1 hypothetical protein PR002_g18779 [Phytophthora rubi]KAE9082924.1 hypothetical protein PF010_g21401 [Phytophthora fragariae]
MWPKKTSTASFGSGIRSVFESALTVSVSCFASHVVTAFTLDWYVRLVLVFVRLDCSD